MITRSSLRQSNSIVADIGVLSLLAAVLYGLVRVAKHWESPLQSQVEIDLSVWALPGYTLLSLLRGFAAYGLSLGFTLVYGYLAAHRPRAERILVPLLDVLQSIPVLGFLPGAVLALVALFPSTNMGLELASILMIFTGQVWNMTFSFYQSLRSLPRELGEASSLYQFNWWQRFRRVELPAAAVGLAWNSMMAMAGGWFFLMVCEAFHLGSRDFRLPGLGAYMSVAIARHQTPAILAGIIAMVTMIVLVDTLVWRPVLVWVQKFRIEDTATSDVQASAVLRWFQRSWLIQNAMARVAHPISEWLSAQRVPADATPPPLRPWRLPWMAWLVSLFVQLATAVLVGWAALRLVRLLGRLPLEVWLQIIGSAGLTLARVMAAVLLGSLWAVPVGIWIGQSDRRRNLLQPLVQIAASFPAPMLYPLILFGLRRLGWELNVTAVILMMLGTQWYILFNVIAGASTLSADFREVARAYRFTPTQRRWSVWWPATFPYVITGWIAAAGGAWNASIVAEYVALSGQVQTAPGLGSLISTAADHASYDLLAAGVLAMALVVVVVNRILWRPLYRLAETRYAY